MRVGEQIVATRQVGNRDGRLEAVRTERTGHHPRHRGAEVQAALLAAVEEEVDAVDTGATRGARIHRDALNDHAAWHDHRAGAGVGQVEADRRAVAGHRGHGGRLRQGRHSAEAQGGGSGHGTEQPQARKYGSGHKGLGFLSRFVIPAGGVRTHPGWAAGVSEM